MIQEIEEFIKPVFDSFNYDFYISESNKKEICDYQINSLFRIAKEQNINLMETGTKVTNKINELNNFGEYFKEVSFLNGFINITMSDKFINKWINNSLDNLGVKKVNNEELYFLDYGGPNIAKPLHIGHLRPAIIGESLKRIISYKGYKTISDVHLGDYGLQMGQVIYGIKQDGIKLKDINIEYLNKCYPRISALCKTNEKVYEECKSIVKELQNGNNEYIELWNKIYKESLKDIKRIYNYLDVNFDLWLGESDTKPYISKLLDLLTQKKLLSIDDGAKIVKLQDENDNKEMPPLIVEKSDGSYMYATTDLAAIYERIEKYNPKYILYVVDARQSLHFEQVFRTCKKIGWETLLEHIEFGTINGNDGKPFKTRSGETLKLDELIKMTRETFISKRIENANMTGEDLDIIVNAIIKYADLSNNREKNYVFDISKFSDVNGKTGPYILYSALRIKKILDNNKYTGQVSSKIYDEVDRNLRIKLLEFDKYITKSIEERLPSIIAEYVYNVADLISAFYQKNNISNLEDITNKNDWLIILNLAYNVIKDCLYMLGIKIPSKM